tara:strand:- start:1362 stop:1808 length:447 start_codon:yes stop_codon:yes gene_type:complete
MGRKDPDADPTIDFDRYKFSDKSRGHLKDYLWGSKGVGFNMRNSLSRTFNGYVEKKPNMHGILSQWSRLNYLQKPQAPKVDPTPIKPAVKGGLGSQKKDDPPVDELKKIMAKESVNEAPREIKRQTVFQPRGARKQIRNPFTGNRPTL